MKIVVGLPGNATLETVQDLALAGANEFFVGYLPAAWADRFGQEFSPNRRYFSGAQIDSLNSLKAVVGAARSHGIEVAVTFNEHFVTPDAMAAGVDLLDDAVGAGCTAIIVADPAIVSHLLARYPQVSIHVSGDAGVINRFGAQAAFDTGATRVILPRELSLTDSTDIVSLLASGTREFEAFVMGEPCVFDGARCFTEHGYDFGCDFCNYHNRKRLHTRRGGSPQPVEPPQAPLLDDPRNRRVWSLGKCGLCALPSLRAAGVTHVKVPGRASQAVTAVRLVSEVLRGKTTDMDAAKAILDAPELCASGAFCYFPEVLDG